MFRVMTNINYSLFENHVRTLKEKLYEFPWYRAANIVWLLQENRFLCRYRTSSWCIYQLLPLDCKAELIICLSFGSHIISCSCSKSVSFLLGIWFSNFCHFGTMFPHSRPSSHQSSQCEQSIRCFQSSSITLVSALSCYLLFIILPY
jgi:hypothetical protein